MLAVHRLRYFQEITRAGSIAAAARTLNVAQPALSHHVRKLEEELGIELLVRTAQGVTATEAGRILARRAHEVLSLMEETQHEVRQLALVPHGVVTIALAVTLSRLIAPALIRRVREQFPLVTLDVHDTDSHHSSQLLADGLINIALVPNASELDGVKARHVYAEDVCLIQRSAEARSRRDPVRFAEIAERPLTLPPRRTNLRRYIEDMAALASLQLNIQFEQHSADTIRGIVVSGLAATLTQPSVFAPEYAAVHALDVRPVVEPRLTRVYSIVSSGDLRPSLAQTAVEEALVQTISSLVAVGELQGHTMTDPLASRGPDRSATPPKTEKCAEIP